VDDGGNLQNLGMRTGSTPVNEHVAECSGIRIIW